MIVGYEDCSHGTEMPPRLKDVAQLAEVSVATASRVITGSEAVRPETRARVERAMRELLYVPPARRIGTAAIGLLVPDFANPIFAALAHAIERRATEAGLLSIVCSTAGSAEREADYVQMLLERRVVGTIFVSSEAADLASDHRHYQRLLEEGARLVFVNGATEGIRAPEVRVDERVAGELATRHLVELGHRAVGFAAGPAHYTPTQEKELGRTSVLIEAGLDPSGLVAHTSFTVEGGREALRLLLARDRRPTGVICSSDLMAIGVLQEALAQGLSVPGDLSIVGFDGIEATRWTTPPLTTVEQPIDDIADTAIAVLQTLVEAPERSLPSYVFRPKLRLGTSTAPPR